MGSAEGGPSEFHVSSFVFHRALALGYFAAFLSLAAQADGLYGCDGAFPPRSAQLFGRLSKSVSPSLVLLALCLVGALLAGALLAAVPFLERHRAKAVAALWLLFCGSCRLATVTHPFLEDKLLLEAGVAGLFLAAGGREVGRTLAAWLLFRSFLVGAAGKVLGACDAWRQFTALREFYQLEAFALPPTWPLWLAPRGVVQALTCLHLYAETGLACLLLAPHRPLAAAAAASQLLLLVARAVLANGGCAAICQGALLLSLLDDGWHSALWSEPLLRNWGCWRQEEEAVAASEEEDEAEEKEGEAAKPAGQQAAGQGGGLCLSFLLLILGYAASLAAVLAGLTLSKASGPMLLAAAAVPGSAFALFRLLSAMPQGRVAALAGIGLWAAGLMQLAAGLGVPGTRHVGVVLEGYHIVHSLEADLVICPHPAGRADLVLQGAMAPRHPNMPPVWLDLSSRFLPVADERRPVWLQPYTPRLDFELWRLAQHMMPEPVVPKWLNRLAADLCYKRGAAARLSAGHWSGLSAALHGGQDREYAKVEPPLLGVRVVWKRKTLVRDIHSNKWWNTTEVKVLQAHKAEDLEKSWKRKKGKCKDAPAILQDAPIAEAALALLAASLLWKLLAGKPAR